MKISKRRIWTIIIFGIVLILFGWLILNNAIYAARIDTSVNLSVMLEGQYSIDGGEWKYCDGADPIKEHFKKAEFKGKFVDLVEYYHDMYITSKNVWFTIKYSDGEEFYSNRRDDLSSFISESEMMQKDRMLSTPGYSVSQFILDYDEAFHENLGEEMTLEVEYPYDGRGPVFSDVFNVTMSFSDGIYFRFLFEALPVILISILVCFFGVFFFPIASVIQGKFETKYISFGALCFSGGFYTIMQSACDYLNLWIMDPTTVMMTDRLSLFFFVIAVVFYLKSVLSGKTAKTIAAVMGTAFTAFAVAATILHMTDTADFIKTTGILYYALAAGALVLTPLLCMEIRGRKGFDLFDYLMSWAPLTLCILLDIAGVLIYGRGAFFIKIGLALTILYQMVRFGLDLRKQYVEAIRYQQVQKELYEAKVSVMTSQIRPHFMYNALTSIAMMCTINPKTAQKATVTFAKYLRGNMDSLKQTAPVPFSQELEHLKKYLYIEKLRFDDLLNIEYDIQATDFELPLLSIQPLVENAVKHGVGMKEDGGTVKISTRETETSYEVIIEDDGVGFDINEQKNDGRTHIGMENTKKRLHDMCGGEVIITSKVGEGTTARVIIPKKEEKGK